MDEDFRVPGLSNDRVKQIAARARIFFEQANKWPVDVCACLQKKRIWTVKGLRHLQLSTRTQTQMGADLGHTRCDSNSVHIEVLDSVWIRAGFGVGFDRNTCAHELGHAVLHHDKGNHARRAISVSAPKWIEPYESAEHQAKVFAAAFLIPDEHASKLGSAELVAEQFGVSLESARIFFKQLEDEKNRKDYALEIRQKADHFIKRNEAKAAQHFLQEPCPGCAERKLIPVWNKFLCCGCDRVYDGFQDGDVLD